MQSKESKDFKKIRVGTPAPWLMRAAQAIHQDFSILTHEYTTDCMRHSMNRHGDSNIHGAAALMLADFERIGEIVQSPDFALIGSIRKHEVINGYAKIDGSITYVYFEEVLHSRRNKALRGLTLYKINKTLTLIEFINLVMMNHKTDITPGRVIAAGGNPGGWAET